MTIDLWMLVWTTVLCSLFPLVYLVGRLGIPGGFSWSLGNRDTALAVPAWSARAERAHANLVENLPPFAVLVLVAHVAGVAGDLTALGATTFFFGRVAHGVLYVAGVRGLRTLAYFIGVTGQLLILVEILT